MNTKKIIFYVLVPAFFIIAIGTLFILNRNKKATNNTTVNQDNGIVYYNGQSIQNNPAGSSLEVNNTANEEKIKIKTASGEISVNNFRKNADVIENGAEYFVDKEKYNVFYYSPNNEFAVTLLVNQDIENTRKEAESDFINALGISKEDACRLKIILYVSAALTTNSDLYQNHGLSFCSGSKTFSQ